MLDKISLALVIIGALNWGRIGLFQFDIVAWIFGGQGGDPQQDRVYARCPCGHMVYLAAFQGYRQRCGDGFRRYSVKIISGQRLLHSLRKPLTFLKAKAAHP